MTGFVTKISRISRKIEDDLHSVLYEFHKFDVWTSTYAIRVMYLVKKKIVLQPYTSMYLHFMGYYSSFPSKKLQYSATDDERVSVL